MFPRFPFFYQGNLGNSQIRQGQNLLKEVARTNIETECFFHFSDFFVSLKQLLSLVYQKDFAIRRGKIFFRRTCTYFMYQKIVSASTSDGKTSTSEKSFATSDGKKFVHMDKSFVIRRGKRFVHMDKDFAIRRSLFYNFSL